LGPFYTKSKITSGAPENDTSQFLCFSTKAVHLELVGDLSTSSFLVAFKRIISLQGKPLSMWTDNTTSFVGVRNDINRSKGPARGWNLPLFPYFLVY